ncbi:MAG: ABC-F family ATP-binding cassette domain-containing protein [Acidimicrobiales bacterium]|jgi:ATPase subunit of ABC transporter with duplicated ATPase domains
MLSVSDLNIDIGSRALVHDGRFIIGAGEKVGLVGRNGTGKSSLISVLVETAGPHLRVTGDVQATGSVGFLPQMPVPGGLGVEPTGFSHVLSARGLDVLDDELVIVRQKMEADPTTEIIERFSEVEDEYRRKGGYEAEAVMSRLAAGLGLDEGLLLEDLEGLSGGQRRRVDLIRVLFAEPDLLVLDEPTNHLDRAAKIWLMEELQRFPGSILLISHDIRLLDRSITKVLNLADSRLTEYPGTYTDFRKNLALHQAQTARASELEGRQISRLKARADSMRGSSEKRAKTAKALDTRVARLEGNRTVVAKKERTSHFKLPAPQRSASLPMEVRGLGVRYDGPDILKNVSMVVGRGDRVVVVGRNGAGKSSLLRCLAGVQEPTRGSITVGVNVTLGYFAQEHEQLDPEITVFEHIDDSILKTDPERRALLGAFGIAGETAYQNPPTLSGGERARLALAMLAAGHANVLILDEPTNNLDPGSVDAVGRMLRHWPGTLIVVSHDRRFLEVLEPTHGLILPSERFDLWRDENLGEAELR